MNTKKIVVVTGFAFALAGITAAIVIPIYVQHEHNQAQERRFEWAASSAEAQRKLAIPACEDGHYSVTDYSSVIPTSIPVWTDEGVIECHEGSYSIKGKLLSSGEAQTFAQRALNQHQALVANSTPMFNVK